MEPKPEESHAPPVPPAAPEPPPSPEALTPTTEVPSPTSSAGELGPLKDLAGDNPALLVILALITTVGGAAGFKLWTKVSEQKHEQSMKKLDLEQANAGLQGAQPPPCQTAHATLVADIKALQTQVAELFLRLEKMEKAASGFDPSVDVGDLEERVEVIEKTLRKKARAQQGGV